MLAYVKSWLGPWHKAGGFRSLALLPSSPKSCGTVSSEGILEAPEVISVYSIIGVEKGLIRLLPTIRIIADTPITKDRLTRII